MPPGVVTLIVAGFGIAGTIGGVFIGQRMSQSWQREQWIRDNRKEEFRELLKALSDHYKFELTMYEGRPLDPEEQRLSIDVYSKARRIIQSRIFVADMVKRHRLELRWAEAVQAYGNTFDAAAFASKFEELRYEIVKEANSDIRHHRQSGNPRSRWWTR